MLLGVLSVAFFVVCLQGLSWLGHQYQPVLSVCNASGPFGIGLTPAIFYMAFFVALFFFGRAWWTAEDQFQAWWWLLIIAAGASNVIERLFYGCVYDFLQLPWLPLFNGADVVLTVSVVFLLWREIRHTMRTAFL